jgi:hypothetical protein
VVDLDEPGLVDEVKRVTVGSSLMVIAASLVLWFPSFWLHVSSGISSAPTHPTRAGEIIGGWGEAVATIVFIVGWLLLAIAVWRRRRKDR